MKIEIEINDAIEVERYLAFFAPNRWEWYASEFIGSYANPVDAIQALHNYAGIKKIQSTASFENGYVFDSYVGEAVYGGH